MLWVGGPSRMMKRVFLHCSLLGTMLAGFAVLCSADTPDTEASQAQTEYDQTVAAYATALAKFRTDYAQIKTEAEQTRLVAEQYPTPAKFGTRFLEIAQHYPGTPGAVHALTWIVARDPNHKFHGVQPREILHAQYLQSDQLGPACRSLTYGNLGVESFLQDVLTTNPSHNVRAAACLSLGQIAERDGNPTEAEAKFNRAISEFGDEPSYKGETVGDTAKNELFEMHALAVGQLAPEITGTDTTGKEFKLSDYRGKVVVINFWGRW